MTTFASISACCVLLGREYTKRLDMEPSTDRNYFRLVALNEADTGLNVFDKFVSGRGLQPDKSTRGSEFV
ncbi:uncharacterized protein Z520_11734 [Fonsecaea multimorphosa CBS 102226]|uniref:Uncharacterized protein n=1 Tax=Fonsecaea multimorphosa CBS 102226 TaxID=1442371 RepID=A0A0D2K8B3_9EURO|nr:uncharacterized protein Z520_11734 [Fonsecaea multimorphosa CBS 102226]KIX92558.1 hypothetical protein Z520_11734 [Fonsecaea multimorphosa CBS 102226]